jgi:UDP-N-acetylenolpyruvoylglucosamine reductase|tara:strand:+ start:183 stop:338 length:156 start_codon:yes stop_codon:yes gene_type:complete
MKEFDIQVSVITNCYGIEAKNKEDVIEQVKDQWWETYGIHLDNSEIKILDE